MASRGPSGEPGRIDFDYAPVAGYEMMPTSDPPSTSYATAADGTNIAYQVVGKGDTDLVFVPGWISNLDLFWAFDPSARFFSRLASFARLIVFDKLGTGPLRPHRRGGKHSRSERTTCEPSWMLQGPSEPRCVATPRGLRSRRCSPPPPDRVSQARPRGGRPLAVADPHFQDAHFKAGGGARLGRGGAHGVFPSYQIDDGRPTGRAS